MIAIKVPPLGESIVEATVSRWAKQPGDPVAAGETLFTVYVEQEARLESVVATLSRCFTLSPTPPALEPLIYKVIA